MEEYGVNLVCYGEIGISTNHPISSTCNPCNRSLHIQFRSIAVIENLFGYQARYLLAAIDYSYQKDRALLSPKEGRTR